MPVQAVLFDAVGTLLHAEPDIATVYARAGHRYGSELQREQVLTRFRAAFARVFAEQSKHERPAAHDADHRRWRQVVAIVFRELPQTEELFEELWQHFAEPSSWRLFADVAPIWQRLQQQGLLVGIASNYDNRILSVVRGHPLLAGGVPVFHSAGLGFAKPDRRFFQAIEDQLDLAPHEILLVGDDSENDYQGGIEAGWQAVFLDRTGQTGQPGAIRLLTDLNLE
jgi:putative hydrolase of the HAD superfamily